MKRLAEWVCRSVDWYDVGRTRGCFTTSYGVQVNYRAPSADAIVVRAPMLGRVEWAPWARYEPPLPLLSLPIVQAPRGGITYAPAIGIRR